MTFNVISPPVKPEYFSQKLETMRTSILIVAILLVTLFAQGQQSKTNSVNFDTQLDGRNDFESSEKTTIGVNFFNSPIFDNPAYKTDFSELDFDPIQFYKRLSSVSYITSNGFLMDAIKETLSYTGELMFNNKKYTYITGMTGKGIGLRISL
jgi:hypothetical protein